MSEMSLPLLNENYSRTVTSSNAAYAALKATTAAVRATTAAANAVMSRSLTTSNLFNSETEQSAEVLLQRSSSQSAIEVGKSSQKPTTTKTQVTEEIKKRNQEEENDLQGKGDIFPQWIRERKDFQVYFPRYADRIITDEDIVRQGIPKDPIDRNIVELQCIARWIMKIPIMRALDLNQAMEIAKLSRYICFKPKDFIFHKGDKGDACYLIFSGEVHVLIDGAKVAVVGKNAAFGDIALQMENAARGADVQAAPGDQKLEVLQIQAEDYHKTLARNQSRRRKDLINWLHTEVTLFRDCNETKLHFFELVSIDIPLKKGQTLYLEGDSVGAFYIVRSGKIRFEVSIQYEKSHRWPCGKHQWVKQVHASKTSVPFHIEEAGGFFGYEMFVNENHRQYTAIADTAAEVVALNRVDCFSPYFSFSERAIDRIIDKHDQCHDLSTKKIHQKLQDFHAAQSKPRLTDREKSPLFIERKFQSTKEGPECQFPCVTRAKWDAPNETVRKIQQACLLASRIHEPSNE